jgi:hypothetical protein
MTRRSTLVLRVCVECRKALGIGVWPWSGRLFTRTHGLCRPCFERLDAALDGAPGAVPARRAA